MKKLTLLAVCAASLCVASAVNAQSADTTTTRTTRRTVSTRTSTALTNRLRRIEAQANSQNIQANAPRSNIDGSVTRAARSGNPLQMVNPFAPAEYGDGRDVTRREADDPFQRPEGLRLFVVNF